MPVGVITNVLSVFIGGIIGYLLRKRFSESLKASLNGAFGLAALVIGISLLDGMHSLSAVILALLVGCSVGDVLKLEDRACRGIGTLPRKIPWFSGMDEKKTEALISVLILILTSTAGIFGAMNEGITGDYSVLLTKSILDFFTAAIFAANVGIIVPFICIPQLALQMALFLSGNTISVFLSDTMIGDFKACGGIIIIAVGFKILNAYRFKVLNFLPALALVLPISYYWMRFIG
ncbi:DUF554 domain-containing protein [Blautia sp. Sow4_E7]|uniref:DUF554 domain-containing protein n=1 Tax=Blautia sp. Sow4_E7 TaxID=3438749 RepID=UPI003F932841